MNTEQAITALAEAEAGTLVLRIEVWDSGDRGVVLSNQTSRIWMSAQEATEVFDFLCLHMRTIEQMRALDMQVE